MKRTLEENVRPRSFGSDDFDFISIIEAKNNLDQVSAYVFQATFYELPKITA